MNVIETNLIAKSNEEMMQMAIQELSKRYNITQELCENAITSITTHTHNVDGEELYVMYKKTKKGIKKYYIRFASWMLNAAVVS